MACMDKLGVTWRSPLGVLLEIDVQAVMKAMLTMWQTWERRHIQQILATNPAWAQRPDAVRAAPESSSQGFKLFVYERWFEPGRFVRGELDFLVAKNRAHQMHGAVQVGLALAASATRQMHLDQARRHERCCP